MVVRYSYGLLALAALPLSACRQAGPAPDQEAAQSAAGVTAAPAATLPGAPPPWAADAEQARTLDESRATAIVRAAARVAPAVVSVSVFRTERVRSPWEEFFFPWGSERQVPALGSGFIVDAVGIILTNDHVIRGADQIRVTLPDGREFDAEVVGSDEVVDVAVLRIRGDSLPLAPLGTSRGLLIGEWSMAIGNPFGNLLSNTEPTVTAGVISAAGRHIVPSEGERGFYLDMIQTDAAINPGNSGGPLVNARGDVIGINTSIFTRGGGSEGLGFAIPIDRARRILDDILRYGRVRRAWVGVDAEALEADVWGRTRGVRVARVAPGSPAAGGGLATGDQLVRAGGRRLTTPLDWQSLMLDLRIGDAVELVVQNRQTRTVRLVAGELPSLRASRVTVLRDIQLVSLTPQIRQEQRLTSQYGALVVDIPAELSGRIDLRRGDLIVQINNAPVRGAEDAARLFGRLAGRGPFYLFFEREGALISRVLEIPG
ncbi:MAG: trypsin-like peptidase domain-containing protein [Gemmatimonadetes bacterium]|nr:trypsin-like peptidase domain-containing protein [Gemmatimonadota bacterium]